MIILNSVRSAQITKNEILSLLKSYLLAPLFIDVCRNLLLDGIIHLIPLSLTCGV